MRVVLLAAAATNYSTERLLEVFAAKGHQIEKIVPAHCEVHADRGIYYRGRWLETPDIALLRFVKRTQQGTFNWILEQMIGTQWELDGVVCANSPMKKVIASNKFMTLQILHRRGVPVPPTIMSQHYAANPLPDVIDEPLIMKTQRGSMGAGVMKADTWEEAREKIDSLHGKYKAVTVQKFLDGRDIRATVVGDRCVNAVLRVPKEGEFRANYHLGGSVHPLELSPEHQRVAVEAALAMEMPYCGVDMIETKDGVFVTEINSNPDLVVEKLTGEAVVDPLVDELVRRARARG
jgi:ribosomal protein S6--L-glutamate ligase